MHRGSSLLVDQGLVVGIYEQNPRQHAGVPLTDFGSSVLIPALIMQFET